MDEIGIITQLFLTQWNECLGQKGYDYNTDTCARAIDEGGMPWAGGSIRQTPNEWMQALETGVKECIEEIGLR